MNLSIFNKLCCLTLMLTSSLFFQNLAYSNSSSTLPHVMLLNYTDKVVLGKLAQKTEFTYIENEKETACAFELEFVVEKRWKGGTESFTMLASAHNLELVEGSDYLIFAMENKQRISSGGELETYSCSGPNISGSNTHYKYTQIWAAQGIFPVIRNDGVIIDGPWIEIYDEPHSREELPPRNIVRYKYKDEVVDRMTPNAINMSDFLEYLFTIKQ